MSPVGPPSSDRAADPGSLSVTVFAALSSFSVSDPKLRLDGLTLAFGAITLAVIAPFCGLSDALSVKVSMAELVRPR
jgi:hypothetical protein